MYNHSFWRVMSHEQRLFNRGFHRWIHVIRAESLPEDAFLVEVELLANEGRGCVLAPWPSMAEDLAEPPWYLSSRYLIVDNPILMKCSPTINRGFFCTAQVTGRSDLKSGRLGTWWNHSRSERFFCLHMSSQYHSARSWPHFPQFHLLGLGCWVLSKRGLAWRWFIFRKTWREKRVEKAPEDETDMAVNCKADAGIWQDVCFSCRWLDG